jgi:hypothetical protein
VVLKCCDLGEKRRTMYFFECKNTLCFAFVVGACESTSTPRIYNRKCGYRGYAVEQSTETLRDKPEGCGP